MLYRVVVKKTMLGSISNFKLEQGMNVEISYSLREFNPNSMSLWGLGELRQLVRVAFKSKYGNDLSKFDGYINSDYFNLEKLG